MSGMFCRLGISILHWWYLPDACDIGLLFFLVKSRHIFSTVDYIAECLWHETFILHVIVSISWRWRPQRPPQLNMNIVPHTAIGTYSAQSSVWRLIKRILKPNRAAEQRALIFSVFFLFLMQLKMYMEAMTHRSMVYLSSHFWESYFLHPSKWRETNLMIFLFGTFFLCYRHDHERGFIPIHRK